MRNQRHDVKSWYVINDQYKSAITSWVFINLRVGKKCKNNRIVEKGTKLYAGGKLPSNKTAREKRKGIKNRMNELANIYIMIEKGNHNKLGGKQK